MSLPAWVRVTLLPVLAAQVLLGQMDQGPMPRAGRAMTTWDAQRPGRVSGTVTRVILARNDTTVPMAAISVTLSQCKHVTLSCDTRLMPAMAIAPGGTLDLLLVTSPTVGDTPSFKYAVAWRTAPECTNAPPPLPDDTAAVRLARPSTVRMVLPPMHAFRSVVRAEVTFFVSVSGTVDSTHVDGVTDPDFLSGLKKSLATYGFRPGYYRDCPVPGTSSVTLTFGPHP